MMLVALLAVPIFMQAVGSHDASYYSAFGEKITAFGTDPFAAPWQEIVTGLGWGLGYFGMPHILVRFMSIEKPSQIKKSATVAIIWVILTLGAAAVIAYLGRTYILPNGESLAEMLLPDARKNIFIEVVTHIFPGFIAGILLSAIIAASMSTADSQLLVASSAFTSDIYKPLIRKNKASDSEMLWLGRVVVLVVAVVAFFIGDFFDVAFLDVAFADVVFLAAGFLATVFFAVVFFTAFFLLLDTFAIVTLRKYHP
jgi:sodium/proline symporter